MILVPFEFLTLAGFKPAEHLNIIYDKLCIYNKRTTHLSFQQPIGVYIMLSPFRYYAVQSASQQVLVDEAQFNRIPYCVVENFRIGPRSGSMHDYYHDDFLMNATQEQCLDIIYLVFKIDKGAYHVTLQGTVEGLSFEQATRIQIIALFAGQDVMIKSSFTGNVCILNADEDIQIQGPYMPDRKMYGVDVTVSGSVVIRTMKQVSISESIYKITII